MATVEVTITGDLADMVDQDFTQAQVRLRANTDFIADRDADKIRVLDQDWRDVAFDGTFNFENVVASSDTILDGTLQYHVDIRVRAQRDWVKLTLGPYVLSEDVDLSDLEAFQPTGVVRVLPEDPDTVLADAKAYTDASVDAHEASPNPHPQYARFVTAAGAVIPVKIILAAAGEPFPPVVPGGLLFYGGN